MSRSLVALMIPTPPAKYGCTGPDGNRTTMLPIHVVTPASRSTSEPSTSVSPSEVRPTSPSKPMSPPSEMPTP